MSNNLKAQLTEAEMTLGYALAKQVPDMARGFTISTNYGDIQIPDGPMAERFKAFAQQQLEGALKNCQAQLQVWQ